MICSPSSQHLLPKAERLFTNATRTYADEVVPKVPRACPTHAKEPSRALGKEMEKGHDRLVEETR